MSGGGGCRTIIFVALGVCLGLFLFFIIAAWLLSDPQAATITA